MEHYADRIKSIHPLGDLLPEQLEEVLAHGEFLELERGAPVFRRGEDDGFAYYLMAGELELEGEREPRVTIDSRRSHYAIGNLHPRPFTCLVCSPSATLLRVDQTWLEDLVARQQMVTSGMQVDDFSDPGGLDAGWMFQMLQSEIFRALPTENIERFFKAVERVDYRDGEVILRQGEAGAFYYMIHQGSCRITRELDGEVRELAQLGPGEAFGEEALISNAPRNATATAVGSCVLMRLGKARFRDLLVAPVVHSVSAKEALAQLENYEAVLLDVRSKGEHETGSFENSLPLPLDDLRVRAAELDRSMAYLTYSDTGARCSSAAFLLCERGLRAAYVEGGLSALLLEAD